MTALANNTTRRTKEWGYISLVLATGLTVYTGSAIFWDPVTNKVTNAKAAGLLYLGTYTGNPDNNVTGKFIGDGVTKIQIDLVSVVTAVYYANGTAGDAIASTDLLETAYALDDNTASIIAADKTALGTIIDVDARFGVGVVKGGLAGSLQRTATVATLPAFAANAIAQAAVQQGVVYDVPATAGASTITLPAAAPDGTEIEYTANGVLNAHTVQYVDATGPTNITTALTASKRHFVRCVKVNGSWRANAYVSP